MFFLDSSDKAPEYGPQRSLFNQMSPIHKTPRLEKNYI